MSLISRSRSRPKKLVSSHPADYSKFLGGIERNASGHIISAKTAHMIWKLKLPEDIELVDNQGSGLELELADKTTLEWEEEFVQTVQNLSKPDAVALPNAAKSFGDISSGAIFFDAYLMASGYLLMFAYTIFMLGKLNTLEVRLFVKTLNTTSTAVGFDTIMTVHTTTDFTSPSNQVRFSGLRSVYGLFCGN